MSNQKKQTQNNAVKQTEKSQESKERIQDKNQQSQVSVEKKSVDKKVADNKVEQQADNKNIDSKKVSQQDNKNTNQDAKQDTKKDVKEDIKKDNKENKESNKVEKTPEPKAQPQKSQEVNKLDNKPANRPINQTINKAADKEPAKNKGNLVAILALLLGVAGTGLGAYSFNELRMLKTSTNNSTDIEAQLLSLSEKINGLEQNSQTNELKQQLANLVKQQAALQENTETINNRIAQVEQMQNGLSKSVATDIDTALNARMGAVDTLLAKVKDIELGQQGLSKNLNEVSAGGQAVNSAEMEKQEVGYLLRMANYKIQSEGDVIAATGLLKMVESKLLAANEGKPDGLIDSVREKLIQLSGVKTVDNADLINELKAISKAIPQLAVKANTAQKATTGSSSQEQKSEEKNNSLLQKTMDVITSGVKYTPKDPSKINISAETALIEKRLMQADIKTAELAIQSHNKVLLAQSIQSIKESLDKYFTNDTIANYINTKLSQLSQSQLDTVLPDLSGLVKQFQATQAQ